MGLKKIDWFKPNISKNISKKLPFQYKINLLNLKSSWMVAKCE